MGRLVGDQAPFSLDIPKLVLLLLDRRFERRRQILYPIGGVLEPRGVVSELEVCGRPRFEFRLCAAAHAGRDLQGFGQEVLVNVEVVDHNSLLDLRDGAQDGGVNGCSSACQEVSDVG